MVMLSALLRRYVEGDVEGFQVRATRLDACASHATLSSIFSVSQWLGMRVPLEVAGSTPCVLQAAMTAEADSLAATTFGPTMLRAIGRCYISQVGRRLMPTPCRTPTIHTCAI